MPTFDHDTTTIQKPRLKKRIGPKTPKKLTRECVTCETASYVRFAGALLGDDGDEESLGKYIDPGADWLRKLDSLGLKDNAWGVVVYRCAGCGHLEYYYNPPADE